MKITNDSDTPLALAVWMVHDEYDYINEPNYVSATRLMKPLRHLILPSRVPVEQRVIDVSDLAAQAMGKALHDSIEKSWIKGKNTNLRKLGYPEHVIDRVLVNPEPHELKEDTIPVYIEQREYRKITVLGEEFTIGGKFDMVAEGIVHDNKSTSAYTWQFGGKDDDYKIQGSLYRWLNPTKITEDFIRVCFIFTDWSKAMAKGNPAYPPKRIMYKDIPLMTLEETEQWVHDKLHAYLTHKNQEEKDLPPCTPEELWMSEPTYKYYADPDKAAAGGRSTKNFDDIKEAKIFLASKNGKGVLKTIPGEAKRCGYCDAYPICTQKEKPTYA